MKRILTILSFLLFLSVGANAQSASGDNDRIVRLYPNPATTIITFDLQQNHRAGLTIHIYNGVLGKRMFEAANVQQKTTINLNDFSRGVYIYHLIDATGKIVESGKFQVSR